MRSLPRFPILAMRVCCACLLILCAAATMAAPPQKSPFAVRGIKGLWWEGFDNYDKALPWVADHGMNFLMFCYTSFPQSGKAWRTDFTPQQVAHFEALAKEADRRGVNLCYSFNPGIWSDPPLGYSDERDYRIAWDKVKVIHGAGIRWFALCLDDINKALTPADQAKFGTLQAAQVQFVNRLWTDMKTLTPRPRLIFCPSAYTTGEAKAHLDYTRAIGEGIDPEVMLFWTGQEVCSPSITAADAREIGIMYRRKPFVWDNYPVNDMFPWRPLLSPYKNRAADLPGAVSGFMANTMRQWELNPLPLSTLADYFTDPSGYNPQSSMERALAKTPKRDQPAVRLLQSLYGYSFWGEPDFPPQPRPKDAADARALLPRYRRLRVMLSEDKSLRDLWSAVQPTLDQDIATLEGSIKT